MKKVLILAYDFPPYVSVGGLRPYSWYKYLHEFDVYPIVVTRQWSNTYGNHLDYITAGESTETIIEETSQGTLIKSPYQPNFANRLMLKYGDQKYKMLRKFISGFFEMAQYLYPIGPKSSLYFAAKNYLKKNKVDMIIASGEPFILFKYAAMLSKTHHTPWIADYRDSWSQNFTGQRNLSINSWNRYFEKKYSQSAMSVITVSHFIESQLSSLIKNKTFHILPNGYDPEAMDLIKNEQQQGDFLSIAFVGTYYKWYPLKSFLSVISKFIEVEKVKDLQLNFYGINIKEELKGMIAGNFPNLVPQVHIFPNQPNELLMKKLAKDNVMLLFNNYFYMGTKIYDYIGIKRLILFCYSNDAEANALKKKFYHPGSSNETNDRLQEELILKTNSGYIVEDDKNLYMLLEGLYREFKKNKFIACSTINEEMYSRKYQVKRLANIISQCAE